MNPVPNIVSLGISGSEFERFQAFGYLDSKDAVSSFLHVA